MKIAHVSLYPPKGAKHVSGSGVISYTKNLIANIDEHEQYVLCDRTAAGKNDSYQEDGWTIERCFDRGPLFAWQLHKTLRRIQPDVIHIQQELALFGGIVSAYLLQYLVLAWRHRAVMTLHGVVDPRIIDRDFVRQNNSRAPVWLVRLAFRLIYTPLARYARHIIVHEAKFKNILIDSYHIHADKISVIPHGVENLQTRDRQAARRTLGIKNDADVALFMGYATGYKGLDLLIDGFAKYAQHNPRALLIIGAGKHPKLFDNAAYMAEYRRLQNKAAKKIPPDQCRWAGFIEEKDITDYYSAADVSVYPYTVAMSSSGPMSFAMGYEKPFLASDAFADIFSDYQDIVFRKTPDALADKLAHFFTHREAYEDISARLKQQRSWTTVGAQTTETYLYAVQPKEEQEHEAEENITAG